MNPNPNPNAQKYARETMISGKRGGPHFTSSFPSAPRRPPPTLLHDANGFGRDNDFIPTFRQPGSTERALAKINQAKYERQERRRACILLCGLVSVAAMTHLSSSFRDWQWAFLHPRIDSVRSELDSPSGTQWNFRNGGTATEKQNGSGDKAEGTAKDGKDDEQDKEVVEEPQEESEEEIFYSAFKNLADINSEWTETDTPFFWHIPRCAGSTVKDVMGQCMSLVSASEVGVREGHDHDEELKIIDYKGGKYVNVDTTSKAGLERAKIMGLAGSGIADVVVSSYLHEGAQLFDPNHRGRSFLLLRSPVDRAVSMYHHIKQTRPELADLTLQDFARGQGIENNWMVRFLVNQMEGELDRSKLELAKEVLRRKFLIGFVDEKAESIKRFQNYIGWERLEISDARREEAQDCIENLLDTGVNVSPPYELPQKGTSEWALISHQTQYDNKLYDYALQLFDEQTKKFGTKEWKKAEKKKKKGGKN